MFPNPASPDEILLKQTDPMGLSDFQQPKHINSTPWPSPLLVSPRPKYSAQNPHQVSQEALPGLHPLKMFYTHTKLPLVHGHFHEPGISGTF